MDTLLGGEFVCVVAALKSLISGRPSITIDNRLVRGEAPGLGGATMRWYRARGRDCVLSLWRKGPGHRGEGFSGLSRLAETFFGPPGRSLQLL